MTKSEYADKLQVSRQTLAKWLNVYFYADLIKLNYRKTQKILFPNQIKFLNEKLCYYQED